MTAHASEKRVHLPPGVAHILKEAEKLPDEDSLHILIEELYRIAKAKRNAKENSRFPR